MTDREQGYADCLHDLQAFIDKVRSEQRVAKPKANNTNPSVQAIFECWNSKKIQVHRALDERTETAISRTLKSHTEAEVKTAIDTYSYILSKPDEFYFSYRWTLRDFLNRGLDRFMDKQIALKNFAVKKINTVQEPVRKKIEVVD